MFKPIVCMSLGFVLVGCHGADRCREACADGGAGDAGGGHGARAGARGGRTITVSGSAEILTAPDCFEISAGFEVQTSDLDEARDESKRRAAALLAVAERHGVSPGDVQSHQLALQPRYDNNYGEHRKLIGYEASRSLTLTLHDIDEVEGVLYDLAAAGANRIDRVELRTSALTDKRAEARVLAVKAAREKAEAMAAALGQTLGEPLQVDEGGDSSWSPWGAPPVNNYVLSNETAAEVSETMASGKIQVRAGVSVVFALQG